MKLIKLIECYDNTKLQMVKHTLNDVGIKFFSVGELLMQVGEMYLQGNDGVKIMIRIEDFEEAFFSLVKVGILSEEKEHFEEPLFLQKLTDLTKGIPLINQMSPSVRPVLLFILGILFLFLGVSIYALVENFYL